MSRSASFALSALPDLRETKVFGRRICYYDIGRGPPLVLVHGVGGDADQWVFCLDAFAASHRVVAIDLPGFGRSDKPAMDYRIAGYVEFMDRFLAALDIARAAVLGHSLGGWIAATFALQWPERVARLLLCNAAGIDDGCGATPVDLNVSTYANMRKVFETMFFDKAAVTDALVDFAYSLHLERGDGSTIRSVLETLASPREKLDDRLAALRVPTLILWGEEDELTPVSMAHAFVRGIPGSRLQSIAKCGHLPPLEKPQEFAAAVLEFLSEG